MGLDDRLPRGHHGVSAMRTRQSERVRRTDATERSAMANLLACARLIFVAAMIGWLVAFAPPALAQQSDAPIDPQADVVNQQTLLREFPRIQGEINQLDPRARVLIQPAGRTWDYFHQVVLRWIGAIAIIGTLAALAAGYFLLGRLRIAAGRS